MNIMAGVIGYGKSARNLHIPLITATNGVELHSIVQRSGNEASENRRDARIYRDYKEILKDDITDLVIITTPNHLHFKMAQEALSAGKHVVVEKPFTVTSEESYKLLKLAERSGLKLTVFQNRRWDGDFLTLAKLIRKESVGRIVEVESRFDRFRNYLRDDAWKERDLPGSGILYDLSPHLIDQAVQLFGTPRALYADIRSQREGETDDCFEIDLHYENFRVKLKAGMLVADETPRFILRGTSGAFVKYGKDPQEKALTNGEDPASPGWGRDSEQNRGVLKRIEKGEMTEELIETEQGNYPAFYKRLISAINGKGKLPVDPGEAADVIRLIELAIESDRGGALIRLND